MALSLVTIPNPTQQYPSGLIAIRAEDFVGGARGTLTTAADSDSLAGTVVVDTQAISLATSVVSFTTRWNAASDTLSVPWATLTAMFPTGTYGAYFFVSMKVEGDTATGGDASNSTHMHWAGNGLGPGMAWGNDTSLLTSGVSVWRSVWGDQFLMTVPVFIFTSQMTGTNMTMRVWGITGGSLSFSIDALYVMPSISDFGLQTFPSDFPVMNFDTDGAMFLDFDSDESDVQFGGHHSVTQMSHNVIENIFVMPDIQQANDEISSYDINGNGSWDGTFDPPGADPQSWISMMAAPLYMPAQNLITDTFTPVTPVFSGSLVVATPSRFTKTIDEGNFSPILAGQGTSEQGGLLRARFPANQTAPTPASTSFVPHATCWFSNAAVISGETNTPNHQHPLLATLEDCVQTFSFDISVLGVYRMFCGQSDTTVRSEYKSHGAIIEIDASGNLDLSLITTESLFIPTLGGSGVDARVYIDGPVNITSSYTPGTLFWLKVDRQRYFWRAKCWADGDPEPDWQVEGFQLLVWLASGGGSPPRGTVAEPYNTNWIGDPDHDIVLRDPLDSRGCPFICFEPDFGQPQADINVYEYNLDYDPDGNILVDMHIEEEKYDGTTWDSITIPYATEPTWRMVEGSLRNRHFDLDTHGYNLRLWKNTGGPVLQQSSVPWLFERARAAGGDIPLYRPRVFSVSDV